jgi:2-dehydro-3-deoxygluconokinase
MPIQLRDKAQCQFDMIALGEIMLRLDPGEGRIRCAREFKVWEGGGEYNVARGLRRCFGLKTAVCTALPTTTWDICLKISFCRAV